MKKIISIVIILCLMMSLVGCAKLVSTENKNVEVVVVDKYYRATYTTPLHIGKTTTIITHPAVYKITVKYNGIEYTISGSDTYNKYKDKVGKTTTGTLEIRTYDDGTVRYDITSLE